MNSIGLIIPRKLSLNLIRIMFVNTFLKGLALLITILLTTNNIISQTIQIVVMPDSIYSENFAKRNNSIVHDLSGNIWLGTTKGLVRLDSELIINSFYTEYNSDLPHFLCQSIAVDTSNHLWVGTAGGVLAEFDQNDNWVLYSPYYDVTGIKISRGNHVWFHSWNSGIAHYDRSSFEWFNTQNSGIPSDDTYDIALQNDSVVWIATMKKGVARYCNGEFTVYDTLNSEIVSNIVYGIEIDTNNIVYCGTDKGLSYFDGVSWHTMNCLNGEIHFNECDPLLVDSENYLWFTAQTTSCDSILVRYNDTNNMLINDENLGIPLLARYNSMIELSLKNYLLISKAGNQTGLVNINLFNYVENKKTNEQINLYPVPASDVLKIDSQNMLLQSIEIYSILGSPIEKFDFINSFHFEISTANYSSGVYLMAVVFSDFTKEYRTLIINKN